MQDEPYNCVRMSRVQQNVLGKKVHGMSKKSTTMHELLGVGFKHFLFSPLLGEMMHFD